MNSPSCRLTGGQTSPCFFADERLPSQTDRYREHEFPICEDRHMLTRIRLVIRVVALLRGASLGYVDPSSGGTLIQLLLGGGLAGVLLIVRMSWDRIRSLLRIRPPEQVPPEGPREHGA